MPRGVPFKSEEERAAARKRRDAAYVRTEKFKASQKRYRQTEAYKLKEHRRRRTLPNKLYKLFTAAQHRAQLHHLPFTITREDVKDDLICVKDFAKSHTANSI